MKKLIAAALILFSALTVHFPAQAGVPCSVPFNLTNGTTADASQVMANYNAILSCLASGAAASGTNSDITTILGLTTPLSPAQGGAIAGQPQGRLTLTTGQPVMTANVINSSTVFYTCYRGGQFVWVFNGSRDVLLAIPGCNASVTQATSGTGVLNATQVFDIWAVNQTGTLGLCVATNGSGLGWAGDGGTNTSRGTGFSKLDTSTRPYITNGASITNCYQGASQLGPIAINQATYLGTEYTTAAGQTSMAFTGSASGGAANVLGLYNGYNQKLVFAQNFDTQNAYTYGSITWRQINGGTGDVITYVDGLADQSVRANFQEICNTGPLTGCVFGIARDWVAAATPPYQAVLFGPVLNPTQSFIVQETSATVKVNGDFAPAAGVHVIAAVESNYNTTANSYYGFNFCNTTAQCAQFIVLTAYLSM